MITVVILQKSAELTQCICKSTPQTRKFLLVSWFIAQVMRFFTYELRVTRFLHELRVTFITYCTSYELIFTYDLRVTIYCTSWDCNVDYVKLLHYNCYSFLCSVLSKIKYSQCAIPEQCILWMNAPTLKIIISYSFICEVSLHFYDLFLAAFNFLS